MSSRRRTAAFFALCVLALLIACRGSDGVTVLKVAHNGPIGHPFQAGFEEFGRVLEDRTDGAVQVQIFENEQLGTEEEATLMVKLGALAASAASAGGGIAAFVPEAEIFNFPFIFQDLDHFYRVLDGPVGERVAARIEEELDVVVLGYWFAGRRNAWNAERPIVTSPTTSRASRSGSSRPRSWSTPSTPSVRAGDADVVRRALFGAGTGSRRRRGDGPRRSLRRALLRGHEVRVLHAAPLPRRGADLQPQALRRAAAGRSRRPSSTPAGRRSEVEREAMASMTADGPGRAGETGDPVQRDRPSAVRGQGAAGLPRQRRKSRRNRGDRGGRPTVAPTEERTQ